jgi:hypothetical protein
MQAAADNAPIVSEYLPAEHNTQAAADVATSLGEYFPAEQLLQGSSPEESLYLPAPHGEQPEPSGVGMPE